MKRLSIVAVLILSILAVFPARAISYSDHVLSSAPAQYFRFGEPALSTVAVNQVGANGAYTGGTNMYILGRAGALLHDPDTAIEFAGNGGLQAPVLNLQNRTFAFEMWFKLDAAGVTGADRYLFRASQSGEEYNLWLGTSGGVAALRHWHYCGVNGCAPSSTSIINVSTNTWHYLVVQYSHSSLTNYVYLDGVLVATIAGKGFSGASPTVMLGGRARVFTDEYAIYTRLLTTTEIADRYALASAAPTATPTVTLTSTNTPIPTSTPTDAPTVPPVPTATPVSAAVARPRNWVELLGGVVMVADFYPFIALILVSVSIIAVFVYLYRRYSKVAR